MNHEIKPFLQELIELGHEYNRGFLIARKGSTRQEISDNLNKALEESAKIFKLPERDIEPTIKEEK